MIERPGQGDVSLPESTEALARWEHDFVTTVLNAAPCLIVVLDRDGRILRFNRACHELTGYMLEEVFGRTVWDFLLPTEQVGPVKGVFEGLVREAPEAGDLRLYPHTYENDWIAKDGTRRSIVFV